MPAAISPRQSSTACGRFVYGLIDNMLVSADFNNNSLIECIPTILDVDIHRASSFIHLYQADYIRKIEDDPSFPSPSSIYSKIEEIKDSSPEYPQILIINYRENERLTDL